MSHIGFTLQHDGFWYAPPMDPSDVLDFIVDLTDVLNGDTIHPLGVSWVAKDITILAANNSQTDQTAIVWLRNGVNLKTASVTGTFVTAGGRTIERTFKIQIRQL